MDPFCANAAKCASHSCPHFLVFRPGCAPNLSHAHHKCPLLLSRLEASVPKFGSGVDELELNHLLGLAGRVHEQRLVEG